MSGFKYLRAVVTGGAGGIGGAIARALAARGARVAVTDLFQEKAVAAAQALGGGARGYRCDVTDRQEAEGIAAAVARDFGGIDLVFANAGVWVGGRLTEIEPREFDWLFDVNVRGAFNTVQAFVPLLLQQAAAGGRARFILTGSENSVGVPTTAFMTAYTATKHAVLAMADGLRRDLDGTGVGVSLLCPGPVNTGIWDARRARHDRYGGAAVADPELAAVVSKQLAAHGQHPDETARLCLEGVANDEFMIITDPTMRAYASARQREVTAALDRLDARLSATHGSRP